MGQRLALLLLVVLVACRKESAAPPLQWNEPVKGEAFARAQHKRVVLFFGADWSKADVELERLTFPHPMVRRELVDFVLIKADMTDDENPITNRMKARFHVVGDPTTIILDSMDGPERVRFTDYVTPAVMAEALATARRLP